MATQKNIVRNLLLYEYQLKHDAETALANINRAKGQQVMSRATAFRWFSKFRDENTDLNDQPRSGRPREIDHDAVIEAIEEDSTLTAQNLADDFNCGHSQISNILKAASKRWRKSRWIPHKLTESQKQKRRQISRRLLRRHRQTPFLNNIITTDEKWVFFESRRRPNQ